MKCLGVEFEYKTSHCTVVVVAITIMIGLLALGFGLAAARTVPPDNIQVSNVPTVENSTLYETTYQRAVQLLSTYPVVDGQVFTFLIFQITYNFKRFAIFRCLM